MEESFFDLVDFVNKPAILETFVDILLCAVPIWVAVMIGLVIGWSWRPRWTGLVFLGLRSKLRFVWTAPPGFGARRLWLAFTALSAFSVGRTLWSRFKGKGKGSPAASGPESSALGVDPALLVERSGNDIKANTGNSETEQNIVTENDLEHLLHLLDGKDGEMAWQSMMERSTSNMTYQAWRHEPETRPTVYRSRTVFEDATPELVRDFFWDDEFRPKWDPMLAYFKILDECPHTGTMIVHWIKKFPFFCSDREYIIGRRIWEAGKAYYCVTKGVPYPALQRRDKPRRVDLYFSSWVIKPVQSRKGDGQLSACEVTLVHYEDMGIPKDVAKLGVRHGMWGTVKKLHSGFRAYQHARKSEASLSRSALMARITTKISFDGSADSSDPMSGEEEKGQAEDIESDRDHGGGIDWKWVVIGGTVALVCGLHTGVIGKALLLGAGQRVARR
uniref:START domain-containing protein n=1 Tax=Davidia involucrata TaxID=16924 RepID=A0A5B7ABK7_DAVIN